MVEEKHEGGGIRPPGKIGLTLLPTTGGGGGGELAPSDCQLEV